MFINIYIYVCIYICVYIYICTYIGSPGTYEKTGNIHISLVRVTMIDRYLKGLRRVVYVYDLCIYAKQPKQDRTSNPVKIEKTGPC